MVRLKNRYLLVHVLNPTAKVPVAATPASRNEGQRDLPPAVVFQPPLPPHITAPILSHAIKAQVVALYGDFGMGLTAQSLSIRYLSPATATFILRVAREHYRLVWAALSFMTQLPGPGASGSACVMRVVRVSGTIRKAEEESMRRARESIRRAQSGGSGMEMLDLMEQYRKAATGSLGLTTADVAVGADIDRSEDSNSENEDSQGG